MVGLGREEIRSSDSERGEVWVVEGEGCSGRKPLPTGNHCRFREGQLHSVPNTVIAYHCSAYHFNPGRVKDDEHTSQGRSE
jgi:hypothetical protein